jgi:hypothetical protein
MKGFVVRNPQDRRSFATSLVVSALVHGALLTAAVLIAPRTAPHYQLAAPDVADATVEPEVVTLVWPTFASEPERVAPVETLVATDQRDLDDGVGEPAAGDVPGATETGNPARTEAPLSPDLPAAQGFGDLALDTPLPERSPSPAPGVAVDATIDVPAIAVVSEGVEGATGTSKEDEDEKEKEKREGGGLGSILDGIGGILDGIKVNVGGTGGGGMGDGGHGGGGKGGCVPGIGGIIGGKGGKPGTVAIPQGPGIRTGIGGRGRFPFTSGGGALNMPSRTSSC